MVGVITDLTNSQRAGFVMAVLIFLGEVLLGKVRKSRLRQKNHIKQIRLYQIFFDINLISY